jgi:hypothetical protein
VLPKGNRPCGKSSIRRDADDLTLSVFWVEAAQAERIAREQEAANAAAYGMPPRTGPVTAAGRRGQSTSTRCGTHHC